MKPTETFGSDKNSGLRALERSATISVPWKEVRETLPKVLIALWMVLSVVPFWLLGWVIPAALGRAAANSDVVFWQSWPQWLLAPATPFVGMAIALAVGAGLFWRNSRTLFLVDAAERQSLKSDPRYPALCRLNGQMFANMGRFRFKLIGSLLNVLAAMTLLREIGVAASQHAQAQATQLSALMWPVIAFDISRAGLIMFGAVPAGLVVLLGVNLLAHGPVTPREKSAVEGLIESLPCPNGSQSTTSS